MAHQKHFWRSVVRADFKKGSYDGAGHLKPGGEPFYQCELECGHVQRVPVVEVGPKGGIRRRRGGGGPPAMLDCAGCGAT